MRAMLQAVSDTGRLPGPTRRPVRAYDPALGEAAMIIAHAPDTQATVADGRQAVQESSSPACCTHSGKRSSPCTCKLTSPGNR
jgi:hypothetical protein